MSRLHSLEGRLGLPVAPTRMERRQILPDSSSDDDSVDEDAMRGMGMGPLDNEDEQERLLSKRHGEAMEANSRTESSSKKRTTDQTDQEIADEYAAAGDKKKMKKPRLTLQPEKLVGGDNGLIVIKNSFPSRMKPFLPSSKPKKNRIDAAALFSRKLVSAYLSYCEDLFPSLAPEDVLLKIESFGSKKQVKDYLQHLREDIRNAHVERLYGLEKGESLIQQLHDGLREQDEVVLREQDYYVPLEPPEGREDMMDVPTPSSDPTGQSEATVTAPTGGTENVKSSSSQRVVEDEEDHLQSNGRLNSSMASKRRIEDSSDEEEANFDQMGDEEEDDTRTMNSKKEATEHQDEEDTSSISNDSTISGIKNPSSLQTKRHVDDSSDEEANLDMQANPNEDEKVPAPVEPKKSESNIDVVEGEDVEESQLESEKLKSNGDPSSIHETEIEGLETQPRYIAKDAGSEDELIFRQLPESMEASGDVDRQAQTTTGEGDNEISGENVKSVDKRSDIDTEEIQNETQQNDSMVSAVEAIDRTKETGELGGLATQPTIESDESKAIPESN